MEYSPNNHNKPQNLQDLFDLSRYDTLSAIEQHERMINTGNAPEDTRDSQMQAGVDELNKLFGESAYPVFGYSVIGAAYKGDELDLIVDDNTYPEIVYLHKVALAGFEYVRLGGSSDFSLLVKYIDPTSIAYINDDRPVHTAYYFKPGDILTMQRKTPEDDDLLSSFLQSYTAGCTAQLKCFAEHSLEEQYALLEKISAIPKEVFRSRYGDNEVHIEAHTYYTVELDNDNEPQLELKGYDKPGDPQPYGQILDCVFIENLMEYEMDTAKPMRKLILDEPCVVLCDERSIPTYLIPISEVRGVLILSYADEQE